MIEDSWKPVKSKRLLIIDHLGTYYATLDREKWWKMEDWIVKLLKLCDGRKNVDKLAEMLSKIAGVNKDDLKPTLKDILEDLSERGIIEFI